jgi:proteasome accessory factor B
VWQHAGLASATSAALVKLRAAGLDVDREALDTLQPRVVADEPAFNDMWEMTISRTPVRFGYRRPGAAEAVERHLEPWGVVTSRDRWYVVGHDRDRGAPRMFRLSRVVGEITPDGRPGSFEVPPGTDVRALTASLEPRRTPSSATVLARRGRAALLRRRADHVEESVAGPDDRTPWDRLALTTDALDELAEDVLAHLGDVVAVEPTALHDLVVARLAQLSGVPA